MGFWTSVALITASLAGAATSIAQADKKPDMPDMPAAPNIEKAQEQAGMKAKVRRIQASRQKTISGSPLGQAGQANIARKTLLGQ
jgi:hypothetical protein